MKDCSRTKITARIDGNLWKRVRIRAIEEEAELQDVVAKALERYLESVQKNNRESDVD